MEKLHSIVIAGAGAGATEVVAQINPDTITEVTGLFSQIVILVVTLIGLFKKKKPQTDGKI